MYFKQVEIGGYDKNLSYLLGDKSSKDIAVVDPDNIELLSRIIESDTKKVVAIIITHEHKDHVVGVEEMAMKYNVPVYIHPKARHSVEKKTNNIYEINDGDIINIGALEIKTIYTPGHAAGAVCLLAENKLITGDTVFVGSCGHCKLPGSNPKELYESLQKLKKLPGDIEVYPGHNYGSTPWSTIEHEKQHNPYMLIESEEEFIGKRMN